MIIRKYLMNFIKNLMIINFSLFCFSIFMIFKDYKTYFVYLFNKVNILDIFLE